MGKVYGIIVSAGKETRFKGNKPKTLSLYKGKSFLQRNYEVLSSICDRVVVVVSHENKGWFSNYDTIVIDSGFGCGDAVMKALDALCLNEHDGCVIVWGDCLCPYLDYRIQNGVVTIPCVWEESPYVSIKELNRGKVKVLFSKYGEVNEPGFHDLGTFYGNASLIQTKLHEFAKKIKHINGYIHKHGNEMQFLDMFNETDIKGEILALRTSAISFNTIEELETL